MKGSALRRMERHRQACPTCEEWFMRRLAELIEWTMDPGSPEPRKTPGHRCAEGRRLYALAMIEEQRGRAVR